MADYDNNNRFALFKQDKGDNPNRPDYTGNINVDGKEYRMAAWIRESKNGLKYLSGNVSEPSDRTESSSQNAHNEGEDVSF
ncbi:MAG: hypothetical protein ISP79_06520 [Methylophilaceae bacterium]|nr:hypothetical protein [Methylophilaceae bacterium]